MPKPLHVVILEDHPADAELMLEELRRAGYDPVCHRVETEADYRRYLASPPDVILADYHLPQFDAPAALQILQAGGQDIPLLVVTGTISEDVAVACMKHGAADYLLKDRLARLGPAVAQALEQRSLRDDRRRATDHIAHLNDVLRAIRDIHRILVRERDPARLLAETCATLVRTRGYRLVWVGGVHPDHAHVVPLARAGEAAALLEQIVVTWDEGPTGAGPTGTAIRTRHPAVYQDVAADPKTRIWKDAALAQGIASAIAVPIHAGARVFGALTVCGDRPDAFTEDEVHLFGELADDLMLALRSIEDAQERKRAEDSLHLQGAALASAPNAIVITDRAGRIAWANPAFTHMTGYPVEEVLGQNPRVLQSGEHPPAFYAALWNTVLAGRMWHGELVNRRKDGTIYREEMTITPVRGAQGTVTHFVAVKQDVTDRRRVEAMLESLARFPEENPQPILRLDLETRILYANLAAQPLLVEWQCNVGDPVPAAWSELVRQALREETRPTVQVACGERLLALLVVPLPEAGYVNIYGRDATDLVHAERRLQRYVKRLEGLHAIDRAILAAHSTAEIAEAATRHLRQMICCARVALALFDVSGGNIMVLAADTDGPTRLSAGARFALAPEAYIARLRQGEMSMVDDLAGLADVTPVEAALRADGIRTLLRVPLMVQGSLIGELTLGALVPKAFDEEHAEIARELADQLAIALESSRLHEAEHSHAAELETRVQERTRELEAVNRQMGDASRHKSEFLANMSHELRTPLNAILGFAQILLVQTQQLLSAKQIRYLTNIHASGQHLLQLINDILDLSKVEAGKFVLMPETLAVPATLEDILIIARGLANKKGQVLQADIAADLPALWADPVRFKQILFNLLSNAVKFTPERGTITVTARAVTVNGECGMQNAELNPAERSSHSPFPIPHSALQIAVTDTGSGIKAEDLPRLFHEFTQLETTRDQHHEGTGLGLALTRRLVELHGGRIWAESEGEGRGSTFTIRLPLGPGSVNDR